MGAARGVLDVIGALVPGVRGIATLRWLCYSGRLRRRWSPLLAGARAIRIRLRNRKLRDRRLRKGQANIPGYPREDRARIAVDPGGLLHTRQSRRRRLARVA